MKKKDYWVFLRMIKELGCLVPMMILTIMLGVIGYLAATAIPVASVVAAVNFIGDEVIISIKTAIIIIVISAVLRGAARYGEQLSGHYIAFKILAELRNKLFTKLRALAPAKLDTKEKGNIISIITSDIELMEVFYAHTIAPVIIAVFTSVIYSFFLYKINVIYGVFSIVYYMILGWVLPSFLCSAAIKPGQRTRDTFGKNNSYLLDSLRGIKEIILFRNQEKVLNIIGENSKEYSKSAEIVKTKEGTGMAITNLLITLGIFINLVIGYSLWGSSAVSISGVIIALVLFASSFGPVLAVSTLSTTLTSTLASARRVFDILDEEPLVNEVCGEMDILAETIEYSDIVFSYPKRIQRVINHLNLSIEKGEKIAVVGESGCGKSTLVKLLMRYYDADKGDITIDKCSTKDIPSSSLKDINGYASQDTFLFNDTIENNIRMGNAAASHSQVEEAAKKAAIHDTIISFENGYQTITGELGSRLSSGEKQRIALARLFLKDSQVMIFDEPTSNLDILNEAEILNSIRNHCSDKTIILISHRKTTTGICDKLYEIKEGSIV